MKGCEEICDCCPDCCKKYWNKNKPGKEITKENEEEEEEEEGEGEKKDDYLNDYKKEQEIKNLQNIEETGKQKEELKNKMREYLSYVKKQVENISHNIGEENAVKEDLLDQIFKINKLIKNFQDDEYFNTNLIEKIQKDLEELQELCSKAGIINLDDFCKENEEWENFLNENNIQEEYEEEKYITEDNFSFENTLEKLKNNFGTYLLEIFKTRLFPMEDNRYEYKNEFMKFYTECKIKSWTSIWDREYLQDFYKKIFQKVKSDELDEYKKQAIEFYKKELLQEEHLYLGYALLTDGYEPNIIEEIHGQIECAIFKNAAILKEKILPPLINSFKHNIVEIIKDSLQEQLNFNKNLQKNNSENIKNLASEKYNEAIENLKGEIIKLKFYDSYNKEMETHTFFKNCKLSVLFDYVLSKGREFYASDDDGRIVDEEYVNYDDEKGKLELKIAQSKWVDSLNKTINQNENITIGEFYEKQTPNVFMFFKKE